MNSNNETMIEDLHNISVDIWSCRALSNILYMLIIDGENFNPRDISTLSRILCEYNSKIFDNFQSFQEKYDLCL